MATPTRIVDKSESQLDPHEANGLATRQPAGTLAHAGPMTAMDILSRAVESGRPVEELKELMAMAREMRAEQARAEYAAAMAGFQADCPIIKKTRSAKITTKAGGQYGYTFADLEEIQATIRPLMAKHGLSKSWNSTEDKGQITCVCTITHNGGHSASASFSCSIDTVAAMSGPQKSAAALTFAQRKSLTQALGIVTGDRDDDAAPGTDKEPDTITDHQAANLDAEIDELGIDRARLLTFAGVDRLTDIPAAMWPKIREKMEQKRESLKNGGKP